MLARIVPFFSLVLLAMLSQMGEAAEFQLRDGDRVVLLGDGLIEQEQYSGWLEVALTTGFPNVDATFRNIGWNGDTPSGASRFGLSLLQAGREPRDEGWKQLQGQLELTKPTVFIVGYGMANAIEAGEAGLEKFTRDYQRLLDAAAKIVPDVRLVLLSPIVPLDVSELQQSTFAAYAAAIKTLAATNSGLFVDLTGLAQDVSLRKDPIHLNEAGYRELARQVSVALNLRSDWQTSEFLSSLRDVIVRKNEWWFHRSRPANMAYVFGFRKKEQGQNAVEIPMFDDLINAEEKRIAKLRLLQATQLQQPEPQVASKFAEFTAQPTPEFTVADGWEVTLWAENPQLNKPIHMNFDPQGRLWVASSEAYPMIEVGQSAPDKILILEDSTGDGRADKSTVFCQGLLIPTGIAPGHGGVYVAQSTDLLFLEDTDNDGKADAKRRVLSGFGTEDTHHNLHTLVWGPDGRLYMNQSVYTRTDTETPHGVARLKGGGGFRLDTSSLRMEIVFRGLWNSWGHQFDAYGQSFLTDGAGFDGVAYSFPGAAFNPTPNARRQLELISPGKYPKFASLEVISGDAYPPDWQGSLVTCDFRANRVTRFSLVDQGAGFITQQQADLLRTSAASFRPIDVKQGPDGALYIADWSNPIINHGEVDFRDPRRDRWHGRIWRVSWKGAPVQSRVDLTKQTTEYLLDLLNSNDRYQKDQARRVLIERGDATLRSLAQWLVRQTQPHSKLQALWLEQAFDHLDTDLLAELLNCENAEVRAGATRVLSYWADPRAVEFEPIPAAVAVDYFRKRIADGHPRVRLEAIRGLSRLATSEAGMVALGALSLPVDRFIEYALAQTVDELSEPLMQTIEDGKWTADTEFKERQLEFVLSSVAAERASGFLARRLAIEPVSADGAGPWIELIGKAGGQTELNRLYAQLTDMEFEPAAAVRTIHALRDAFRLRNLRPQTAGKSIGELLAAKEHNIRIAAIELAGTWKLGGQVERISELVSDEQTSATAIAALGEIGNPAAQDALESFVGGAHALAIRANALATLNSLSVARAAEPFLSLLREIENEQTALDLWRRMLATAGTGKALASKLEMAKLSDVSLQAAVRATRDGGRNEPELSAAIAKLSGKSAVVETMTADKISQLTSLVVAAGNATRGERVYRRQELACGTCHAIGGVGGKVGPDMTSIGASAPVDYIIESLFNPNAKIKEGFHSVTIATEDGQVLSGIEVSSNDSELVIRDIANKLVRIPQAEVAGKKPGMSLMPTGVVDRLSETEQIDLIAFLTRLGKPGEFDASRGGVARRFEIFPGTHRVEQQGADRIVKGDIENGWLVYNCLAGGDIDMAEVTAMTVQPVNISLVNIYARTTISSAAGGLAKFTVNAEEPLALWIDGESVAAKTVDRATVFETELQSGSHTLVLRFDARELPARLSLTSPDVTFATE